MSNEKTPKPSPKRRSRWLPRILGLLLLAAVGLAAAWWTLVEPYRQQREVMKTIEELGGRYETQPADWWLRSLFGDDLEDVVAVDLAACNEPEQYLDQIVSLPRLETLIVGGANFTDEHLRRLHALKSTLKGLALEETGVTELGISQLNQQMPSTLTVRVPKGGPGRARRGTGEYAPRRAVAAFPPIQRLPVKAPADVGQAVRDDELVLGVEINGQSRAYPINQLTGPSREVLNDTLGGRAIAATW